MDRSAKTKNPSGGDEQRLQQLTDTFQEAWKHATSVNLQRFLPPPQDPLRTLALYELVKADLRMRWQLKKKVLLEAYLKEYPELGGAAALPASLILEEYSIRQLYGDRPQLDTYRQRFPRQFPEMQRLMHEGQTQPGAPPPPGRRPSNLSASVPDPSTDATIGERPKQTVEESKPKPLAPTQIVNGYKLFKRIGSGSFAEVWKGEAPGGFPVAIKRIIKAMEEDQAQRELQSLDSIKVLRHMFLLQTHSTFIHENHLYVVMELADGTLRDRMKECHKKNGKGIPLEELLRYFREAAEALDYMHSQRMMHRDIKPANILLLNGHAKVGDFGLALLEESERMLFTASGSGTPAYMAPEVWKRKVSPHSDQYSLAFAYAEQRLGRWAFSSTDLPGLMRDHLEGEPELTGLIEAESAVVRKALAKSPNDRYPNCLAFVAALEDALVDELQKSNPSLVLRGFRPSSHGPGSTKLETGRRTQPGAAGSATTPLESQAAPVRRRSGAVLFLLALLGFGLVGGLAWHLGWIGVPVQQHAFAVTAPVAPALHRGEAGKLVIAVQRTSYQGAIDLEFVNLPINCHVEQKGIAAGATGVELTLLIGPDAKESENHPITLRAKGGTDRHEVVFPLTIKELRYYLPPSWKRGEAADLRQIGTRAYYDRIDVLRAEIPIRFLLIARTQPNDPPTFYIMEDKVWLERFEAFATKPPRPLKSQTWRELPENKLGKDFPVMGVVAVDAELFAHWLGGELPTPRQWDKAAGRYDANRGEGPFEPGELAPGDIAINLKLPVKRGSAPKDRSPLGCHDMAGNGLEWTGVKFDAGEDGQRTVGLDKLFADEEILLRGQRFTATRPLLYKDLEKSGGVGSQRVDTSQPGIGFRVVIEPERLDLK
jgi:serine/threonine protein kinase